MRLTIRADRNIILCKFSNVYLKTASVFISRYNAFAKGIERCVFFVTHFFSRPPCIIDVLIKYYIITKTYYSWKNGRGGMIHASISLDNHHNNNVTCFGKFFGVVFSRCVHLHNFYYFFNPPLISPSAPRAEKNETVKSNYFYFSRIM